MVVVGWATGTLDFESAHQDLVINPAERNALVGIKPTVGLTSRAG